MSTDSTDYYDEELTEENSNSFMVAQSSSMSQSEPRKQITCTSAQQDSHLIFSRILHLARGPVETFCLSPSVVLALLKEYKWSDAAVMEALSNDDGVALRKLRLKLPGGLAADLTMTSDQARTDQSELVRNAATVECLRCWDDITPQHAVSVRCCRHWICLPCMKSYLVEVLTSNSLNRDVIGLRCPMSKCPIVLPMEVWHQLSDAEQSKFERTVITRFVEENRDTHTWCPNPKGTCDTIVALENYDGNRVAVECTRCNYAFCFACGAEDHYPASCEEMTSWAVKCRDDSETANWLTVHTKACPKCRKATEKNGGCNHMTCKCGHNFCWICLGDWASHGSTFYQCNFFNDKVKNSEKAENLNKESARLSLERYMHYFSRFQNHDQSKRLDAKVLGQVQDRIRQAMADGMHAGEATYLEQTAHTLFHCRSTLKFSYVYTYYLPQNTKTRALFEHCQGQLELATEQLSKMIEEKDVNREVVMNRTAVAGKMLKNLQEGVFKGE